MAKPILIISVPKSTSALLTDAIEAKLKGEYHVLPFMNMDIIKPEFQVVNCVEAKNIDIENLKRIINEQI